MKNKDINKTRIIVIEDEPTQRRILQEHLEALECEVITAVNGKEGLQAWRDDNDTRIVITDLEMPEMNGFEVLKKIRQEASRYTYVMILTTHDDKASLLKGLANGADDFVSKPVVKEELALRLRAATRQLRLEDHDKLVVTLSELAALRSGELDEHLKRVKEYCAIIAEDLRKNNPELGVTEQMVEDISGICVLHDIGKISIPDGLLNKRGKYTPKEYEIIQEHTTTGARMFENLSRETGSSFLHIGYEIAMFHHEKWDGSGYPEGRKGEEIPLSARIMAFADAYDAIRSRRTYKDALPHSHADTVISQEKGKHFDPLIVEAYERNKDAFAEIHRKYPDKISSW